MTRLNAVAFARARGHLEEAHKYFVLMGRAIDLHQMTAAWSGYLTEINRAFTKLKKACAKGPAKGWYDQIENLRREDDLLRYIMHARNADEHGIDHIAGYEAFRYWKHPDPKNDTIYLNHIRNGIEIVLPDGELPKGAILVQQISRVLLREVIDRGETYPSPRTHLGKPIPENEWFALAIAQLAMNYMAAAFSEAEAKYLR